mgnify:CR=1 FL=1
MTNLIEIANEVNKNWTSNYKAEIQNDVLVVSVEVYDKENESSFVPCAYVNEKLNVTGHDEDAISQLEFYINA